MKKWLKSLVVLGLCLSLMACSASQTDLKKARQQTEQLMEAMKAGDMKEVEKTLGTYWKEETRSNDFGLQTAMLSTAHMVGPTYDYQNEDAKEKIRQVADQFPSMIASQFVREYKIKEAKGSGQQIQVIVEVKGLDPKTWTNSIASFKYEQMLKEEFQGQLNSAADQMAYENVLASQQERFFELLKTDIEQIESVDKTITVHFNNQKIEQIESQTK